MAKLTATEKELLKANKEIAKMKALLVQVDIFMEQERMNDKYDGVWRDDEDTILKNVKSFI